MSEHNLPEFKEKFVAFVDILGFKDLVKNSESGNGLTLNQILELLKNFGAKNERQMYGSYGPSICPNSQRIKDDLDFQLLQISDCVVISTEISPAGAINLINFCWNISMKFLQSGLLCRGHITRGLIYHSDEQFIGTAYQNACDAESKVALFQRDSNDTGTPFIEIDKIFSQYVKDIDDPCINKMFHRMTRSDGDGIAIFPFQSLQHSFSFGGSGSVFNADSEREANENIRKWIQTIKEKVIFFSNPSNPRAMRKIEHYIAVLDEQLAVCDEADEIINRMS
ncbi:hypothetical protein [Deefgea rivuli]|uniref:hypothetical protein n=1 Tax=Deefgea rivuli TaxID=400948 RepID=UPI000487A8FB|nr:hypothetical protein [Deefgea rivuli]